MEPIELKDDDVTGDGLSKPSNGPDKPSRGIKEPAVGMDLAGCGYGLGLLWAWTGPALCCLE